ncbi:hypothetical protein NC651_011337 [Populus alba x Populus x berolinensis]|nr:hypothetical protein NC651_011337 [Populus alba x Populus x berolinensis]
MSPQQPHHNDFLSHKNGRQRWRGTIELGLKASLSSGRAMELEMDEGKETKGPASQSILNCMAFSWTNFPFHSIFFRRGTAQKK